MPRACRPHPSTAAPSDADRAGSDRVGHQQAPHLIPEGPGIGAARDGRVGEVADRVVGDPLVRAHEHRDPRAVREGPVDRLGAVHLAGVGVHEHQVGHQLTGETERGLTGRRLADDLKVILVGEQAGEPLPEEGMIVEVEDEDGYVYIGTVMEVTDETVVVDFNPPLAGKTLTFDVEVLSLREADDEEKEHGHPHSLNDFYDEDEEGEE